MTGLPRATEVVRHVHDVADCCVLTYEDRFLRRKALETRDGLAFLVDLPQTTDLRHGDALRLEDGRLIGIRAAVEPLLEVTGDLTRLAWHIGNRHAPAQIEPHRLLIRDNHVMRDMLGRLGATVRPVMEPFTPEGGAYGQGRTHGHAH